MLSTECTIANRWIWMKTGQYRHLYEPCLCGIFGGLYLSTLDYHDVDSAFSPNMPKSYVKHKHSRSPPLYSIHFFLLFRLPLHAHTYLKLNICEHFPWNFFESGVVNCFSSLFLFFFVFFLLIFLSHVRNCVHNRHL